MIPAGMSDVSEARFLVTSAKYSINALAFMHSSVISDNRKAYLQRFATAYQAKQTPTPSPWGYMSSNTPTDPCP